MTPRAQATAEGPPVREALDPALLRFIEALARAHVDEDYTAAGLAERREVDAWAAE